MQHDQFKLNNWFTQEASELYAETVNTHLNDYESLAILADQMRTAADRGEWDTLIALEPQYNRRVAGIAAIDELPDETARLRMVQLLKKILADDIEIRGHTEIWLSQLKGIMQSNLLAQRLNKTYGGI